MRHSLVCPEVSPPLHIAGLVVAIYAAWVLHDMPDASELADYRPATATRVFAGDGTLIGEFSDQRRIYVTYDQVPEQVIHAFLAAEDALRRSV